MWEDGVDSLIIEAMLPAKGKNGSFDSGVARQEITRHREFRHVLSQTIFNDSNCDLLRNTMRPPAL